jgi:hypothetical protein
VLEEPAAHPDRGTDRRVDARVPADGDRPAAVGPFDDVAGDRGGTLGRDRLFGTEFAGSTTRGTKSEERGRREGIEILLHWLAGFDGCTWQQRWIASGVNDAGSGWTDLIDHPGLAPGRTRRLQLIGAAGELIMTDVVHPSYRWLYGFVSKRTFAWFPTRRDRAPAFQHLTRILIHNGGALADITVEDCLESYRAQVGYSGQQRTHWYRLLNQAGLLASEAPPSIIAATRGGQRSVGELVDGYRVENVAVRNVLVDYLHERQAALDYTSLAALASKLVLLFWRDLELHEPGIDTLHLSDETARRWKDLSKSSSTASNASGNAARTPTRS